MIDALINGKKSQHPVLAMLGVNMMVFMATLDMSIVNVSLPTLVERLHTDFATIQWVILSYVLVIACLLLLVSRLGDMRDKKPIFALGLTLFTLASLLCGLAPNVYWLIAFRGAQGIGAAMSQALGIAIVTEIAPPSSRGRAIGFIGATVALGLMIGPSFGGILIGLVGWRTIFFINFPVGIAAMIIVRRYMPHLPPVKERERFDMPGAAVTCLTLGCYSLGMTVVQKRGFEDPAALGLLGVALAGLLLLIAVERRAAAPMLDLTLFKNPLFSLNLAMAVLAFIAGSSGFIMPFFLQMAQGRDVLHMGLLMMIIPASMGLTAPFAGALSDRYGSRLITTVGLVVMIGGCLALGTLAVDTPWWGFLLRAAPFGLGIGIFQAPNNSAVMGAVPRDRLGVASGLLNYSRVFGQSTGLPLIGTIFTYLVLAITHIPARTDFAAADPAALAAGVAGVYRYLAAVLVLALAMALVAWRLDPGRPSARGRH